MQVVSPSVVSRAASRPYHFHRANAQCFDEHDRVQAWAGMAFDALELVGAEPHDRLFQAEAAWARADRGEFCVCSGSSYTARGTARDAAQACLMIVFIQKGMLEIQGLGRGRHVVHEGSMAAFRCLADLRFHWHNAHEMHVLLPAVSTSRVADDANCGSVVLLDHSALAPFLRSQMVLLAQRAERLDPVELAGVLDPMLELAQKVWLNALRQPKHAHTGTTLYEMAIDLIESHCHKPEFGVSALVRALGCSRAKLYRAFALQGDSVTAAVRNARLQRARQLIEAGGLDTPIGTLAYACGFVDQSTFGKMFRRHFGVSPGRWRRTLYNQSPVVLSGHLVNPENG